MVHDRARAGQAVERRTGTDERKRKWLPLLLGILLVPLLLALLTLVLKGQDIEDQLTEASETELHHAGLGGVGVHFDGRDGSLTGVPDGQEAKALDTVEGVAGVRVANAIDATGNLDVTSDDKTVTVSGTVSDDETRESVLAQATDRAGGKKVIAKLKVTDGALLPGNSDRVGALLDAMATERPGQRHLTWDNDGVKLTGDQPDGKDSKAVLRGVDNALPGVSVDNQLKKTTDQLRAEIERYLMMNPIRFVPYSAELTPEGAASVEHVAKLLAEFPDVVLKIEGNVAPSRAHRTKSSPYQRTLSANRANTVEEALVASGVSADNITAEGLGVEGPNPGRRADITIQ